MVGQEWKVYGAPYVGLTFVELLKYISKSALLYWERDASKFTDVNGGVAVASDERRGDPLGGVDAVRRC